MSLSVFDCKAILPSREMLEGFIGESIGFWEKLFAMVEEMGTAQGEWKFYSQKAGWSYVVKKDKRTLLYLIPQNNYFKVNFVLGEKAAQQAEASQLPTAIKTLLAQATPYREGRSVLFDVKNKTDFEATQVLLAIKNKN